MNGHAKQGSDKPEVDVVIIGAGISGINTAYRVKSNFPSYSYAILEARDAIGGTWDLFKYPGIRSDSDLFTFGFEWQPWEKNNPIASGDSIKDYLNDTVAKHGIDKHIRFQSRVAGAAWSSASQRWTLTVERDDAASYDLTARFVVFGTGYYDYNKPLQAEIPGIDSFGGQVIHPQFWPEDLDYEDKKVVVIGSGATAITLVPKLAEKAAHATMLQRSPTYILGLPNSIHSNLLSKIVPRGLYLRLQRIQWILAARFLFLFCTWFPMLARFCLKWVTKWQLPKHVPFDPHFKPRYNPWEQRMCICPNSDFFKSLHTGRTSIVTDTIRTINKTGIELNSGQTLDADIIITATGLRIQLAGGVPIEVDGIKVNLGDKFLWNGCMVQDMPNAAFMIGYTNASWTLGADACASLVVRLLQNLEDRRYLSAVPRLSHADNMTEESLLNLNSTYIKSAQSRMPKVSNVGNWGPRKSYWRDDFWARHGTLQGLEWAA